MGTTANIVLLLLTISKSALLKPVDYQPFKIIVHENFHDHSHGEHHLPSRGSSFVHQGANFFFNPHVRLPSGTPHIEPLIASLHHKDATVELETKPEIVIEAEDKIDAAEPIELPVEVVPGIINKDESNVVETIEVDQEPIPMPNELLPAILDQPVLEPMELPVIKPMEVVEEDIYEPELPINDESERVIQELMPMPPPPMLPPLAFDFIRPVVTEEVKIDEPIEVVKEEPVLHSKPDIITGSKLPSFVAPRIQESLPLDKETKPSPHLSSVAIIEEKAPAVLVAEPEKILESPILEKVLEAKIVQSAPNFLVDNIESRRPVPLSRLDFNKPTPSTLHARNYYFGERIPPNILMMEHFPKLLK